MIYLVSILIFLTVLTILSNILIFSKKINNNKKRIRTLEKDLLWKVPKWLLLFYSLLPKAGKIIIKKRKDSLLEKQLLELLGELSSNLVGGISTSETIEQLLANTQAPLKNKLSLYIMLSKKHGSINILEQMIGKEHNVFMRMFFVMMLNHVKNGGAIAESIKKLQRTLFLRTNIKQRITAQLLQTKIQIIAGTILPYFMFGVMSLLYGDLIDAVFASRIGIGMLLLAMVLHIIGVLSFIKICRFNMSQELNGSMLFEYMSFSLKNGMAVITSLKEAAEAGLIAPTVVDSIKRSNSTGEIISTLLDTKETYIRPLSAILKKGYSLGISISEDLSYQAQDILEKLEQRAIRFQQAAPAKALVPMLFCIFPATYLMILAPVLVQVFN